MQAKRHANNEFIGTKTQANEVPRGSEGTPSPSLIGGNRKFDISQSNLQEKDLVGLPPHEEEMRKTKLAAKHVLALKMRALLKKSSA